jgi:SAM-dependent methyltransferase
LKRRLPLTGNGEKLLDVGCGSGAFTIGAARRGYQALGLDWDEKNLQKARQRAQLCGAGNASFEVCDVRQLDQRTECFGRFDVAICAENIEHILDDFKLMRAMARCLKPGGRLLLTTPNFYGKGITPTDDGPFSLTEDGWHVRRGYTREMLYELCAAAGLVCEEISYCSGFFSQKATFMLRIIGLYQKALAWGLILPFRPLIPLCDPLLTACLNWPRASICLEAYKPRSRMALAFDVERDHTRFPRFGSLGNTETCVNE